MTGFIDSFLISEVFISLMIILTLYYLFFSQKKRLKESKKTVLVFSIILFVFFQHVIFEIIKYFLGVSDIVFFRFIANIIFVPLMFFLFFYIKKDVNYKLWIFVISSYFLAVFFVGIGWFYDYDFIAFSKTFFKISTSISFYILVIEFLMFQK